MGWYEYVPLELLVRHFRGDIGFRVLEHALLRYCKYSGLSCSVSNILVRLLYSQLQEVDAEAEILDTFVGTVFEGN
jgi:hypothetical protein